MMMVNLKQMVMQSDTQTVTTDSLVQTVSLLFSFEGNLAGFEVYYIAEPDVSKPVHLTKLMQGNPIPETPFCYYRLLNENLLEVTFPKNIYFTPEIGSEIRVDFYTSLGKAGEFDSFTGALTCGMESETYPYNNNMTLIGFANGASVGGKDVPSLEKFTQIVHNAYSTNNTFTTANDLQIRFDALSENDNNRVKFRKKRSDIRREYGAYILLKDSKNNVVPTNTLSVQLRLDDFDTHNGTTQKAIIKPGAIFEYNPDANDEVIATRNTNMSLVDNFDEYNEDDSKFLYTNPFLIAATLYPNVLGYYNNSINDIRSINYTYINDESQVQFIGNNLSIYRNAINQENFYQISFTISPTTDIDPTAIVEIPQPTGEPDDDYYFRAEKNGKVISLSYDEDSVTCTIRYEDGEEDTILVSSIIEMDTEDEFMYESGYTMLVDVYDTFIEGDILAVKKVTDLGKIRACINIQNNLYEAGLYIPMSIEEYDKELNTYTIRGYISTDDIIDNDLILIEHGIMSSDGGEDDNVSIPYSGLSLEISVFYNHDDFNYQHKYSDYAYFRMHTLTNTYVDATEGGLDLIEPIDFIKSTMTFTEGDNPEEDVDEELGIEDDGDDYIITIREVPLTKADWLKNTENFKFLLKSVLDNYKKMQDLYFQLENNFGIDMKFYNTYGKSRFFRAGIRDSWVPLNHVNVSFRFGVYLSSIVNQETFLNEFREYVKMQVESINSLVGVAQSIYIFNLIHDIKDRFKEIGYIEYYGFDEYGYEIQKIEPVPASELGSKSLTEYIPEFINIGTVVQNRTNVPNIEVTFLDKTEVAG